MRRKKLGPGPYAKMVFGMIRDITLVLLAVTVIIVIPGLAIYGIEERYKFIEDITSDEETLDIVTNPAFDIFVYGAAFDCFIIGICAIIYGIMRCLGRACNSCCCVPVGSTATTYYTYNTYNYRSTIPAWWWWYVFLAPPRGYDPCCCCCCCCNECCCGGYHHHHHHGSVECRDCGDCCAGCVSCSGDTKDCGDAGSVLIVVLIVIVIIIIMIGFVVGVVLLTILTARIIRNHITILQKQKDAQELEVVDLSHGLAKDDPSIIVLNAAEDFVSPFATSSVGYVPPAPPAVDYSNKEQQQYLLAGAAPPPMAPVGADPMAPPMAAANPMAPPMVPIVDPNAATMSTAPPPNQVYYANPPQGYQQPPM